jgi:hypothetical protein
LTADNSVFQYSNANDMRVTQDLNSIILMWYTRNINIYIYIFINWTLCMSNNLPERVQILCHAHIICITVLENRIICCQIFCDLLLKSAFERIFNVMQMIPFPKYHYYPYPIYHNRIITQDLHVKPSCYIRNIYTSQ